MFNPKEHIEIEKKYQENLQRIWEKDHPEETKRKKEEKDMRNRRRLQGEIFDPFTKKWLESEVSAARIALIIGMILTALIKGQVFLWAIMYIAYRGRVKKVRREALEQDWED